MIDLYYWGTANGHKITMFLEEYGVDYKIIPVEVKKGEQFRPEFLAISPNNKMPAIVDHDPEDGGPPISVFESGAILVYLADKIGQGLPSDLRGRKTALEWLFWQMGGLGPIGGQFSHFNSSAPERLAYPIKRFGNETTRLFTVLEERLAGREFIADAYSVADMACYPWVSSYELLGQNIDDFPNLKAWCERIRTRPSTIRAYVHAETYKRKSVLDEEERRIMFDQSIENVKKWKAKFLTEQGSR
ncbi:MAG: glutathione binding-like protein [Hyphomonadaceae bacterium]